MGKLFYGSVLAFTLPYLANWTGIAFAGVDKNTPDSPTREIMDSLIKSFSEVLPLSFDMKEFSSAKQKSTYPATCVSFSRSFGS